MSVSPMLPVEIVAHPAQLDLAVQAMAGEPAIALDTESNSFHRYPEQLCLIQIATRHQIYLIDSIALTDLEPLREVLADKSIEKAIHGADYDIRSLDRHSGLRIHNLYDTNIAARFAGLSQVGLAALLEGLLGITIPKSKRLQRADWGRRPLSAEALDYAAADVRHLLALREVLSRQLLALRRTEWAAEECARLEEVRYAAPNPEDAFLSVKGNGGMDGRGLAILQRLFLFREEEARRQCRPPFFVLPNSALIFLATNPTTTLAEVPGLGQAGLHRFGHALQQALRDGLAAPPVRRPRATAERASPAQGERLRRLKAWRTKLGDNLSLDPSLLWPTASLERLAKAPATLDAELASSDVRRWQRDQFAAPLRAYLKSLP